MSQPDDIVDIRGLSGGGPAKEPAGAEGGKSPGGRPSISVHFACCNVLVRVYLNAAGDAFVGWCPRCAKKVTARISPDGTTERVFTTK